jgi:hypothetical protein
LSALLAPAAIAITAIIGVVLAIANVIDVLKPDKPKPHLYKRIKDAKEKGRWK